MSPGPIRFGHQATVSSADGPGSRLGELVAETETRSAVFVARRPSVRARMASCPFDDPPSWWMVKKCVPDQKIVTRWEGDGEEAYEVPLPVEVQSFLAMSQLTSPHHGLKDDPQQDRGEDW